MLEECFVVVLAFAYSSAMIRFAPEEEVDVVVVFFAIISHLGFTIRWFFRNELP